MDHLTAKVSCFARAYHRRTNAVPVFDDTAAEALLGEDFPQIAQSMKDGAAFFLPGFTGTPEEALRRIVDGQLAPSVLARSAYCEEALAREIGRGCRQYAIFAAGYDSFAIRNAGSDISVFELDLPETADDKRVRTERSALSFCAKLIPCDLSGSTWTEALLSGGYCPGETAFCSMLGISYYLSKPDLRALLRVAAQIMSASSVLCFDYPADEESRSADINHALAHGAGETMKARYSPRAMEALLRECGFHIREHLAAAEMTERFFSAHNRHTPEHPMAAPDGVRYILAERN